MLIIGPSYRRRNSSQELTAFERYDGIFYRLSKKYLKVKAVSKLIDIFVINDSLRLIDGSSPTLYIPPEGIMWNTKKLPKDLIAEAIEDNAAFSIKKIRKGKYSEIFIAMGKEYAKALPDLSKFGATVIFPSSGGLGPKAVALKDWFLGIQEESGSSKNV